MTNDGTIAVLRKQIKDMKWKGWRVGYGGYARGYETVASKRFSNGLLVTLGGEPMAVRIAIEAVEIGVDA